MTVIEKLVSLPVAGSHDRMGTALLFCSPGVVALIFQMRVPLAPMSFPVVSDDVYVSSVTLSPGVKNLKKIPLGIFRKKLI